MTESEKRALIDRYIAAYNAFDVAGMMATVHPAVEFENVSDGVVDAGEVGAFRAMAESATALFASRRQTVTAFDPSGAGASVEVDYEGALAADLPNGMAAGDTLRLAGRSEFEFADGRIVRIRDLS
ncbi:MAG: nuclear transport factor 2 family protein [Rhodothermales bacterium]